MFLNKKIEAFFEAWSEFVVRQRWLVLTSTLIISFAIWPQLKHGYMDLSLESYLPINDPALIEYNRLRDDFDYANNATVAIETDGDLFTLENLGKLKALHDKIGNDVPHVSDITSLVNVSYTRGDEDTLISKDLFELWPKTESEIPAFRELVMANHNYVGALVSEDMALALIVVKPNIHSGVYLGNGENDADLLDGFDDDLNDTFTPDNDQPTYISPEEEKAFSETLLQIRKDFTSDGFKVHTVGGPPLHTEMSIEVQNQTGQATLIGAAIIIVLLALLFRRISGVVLPILIVMMALVTTFSWWPVLGYAYGGNVAVIPSFLLAIGIAVAVHILSIFYRHYDGGMAKDDAIVLSMKQTAIAILMTTATTAAGLLSFLLSDTAPTQALGLFGAIGVVMALIYTMTLLPAVLAIIPIIRKKTQEGEKSKGMLLAVDRFIDAMGNLGIQHAKLVVVVSIVFMVVAGVGVAKTKFSHDPIRWYPADHPVRTAAEMIDDRMDGSMSMQVIVDSHQDNGLHQPGFLKLIEDIENIIEEYRYKEVVAKDAISLLSVVKETHKALNGNDTDYFTIPNDKPTIAQELLLFENSGADDINDFTDSNFRHALIDVQMPWSDVLLYEVYIENLHEQFKEAAEKRGIENVSFTLTGILSLVGTTTTALIMGTVNSYLMAFALVGLFMILLMRNVKHGLIALVPNLLPIIFIVGVLGLIDMPLNMLTATIGCIIIGISVDDTIHFMHHFRYFIDHGDDTKTAIRNTLKMCGRALTFTSIVLVGGFIVHIMGVLITAKQFGFLLSLSIILALFSNLVLAPALITLFWEKSKVDDY